VSIKTSMNHHSARHLITRCILSLAALLLLINTMSIMAQSGNTIDFGQTITGSITAEAFRIVYAFQGRKGDVIDAALTTTSGNLDPVLLLNDDQGQLLARNDDNTADLNAALVSQPLPRDGTYFLTVTRFGQARGTTSGDFSLTLTRAGVTSTGDTVLQYGDSLVGEINTENFQHIYAFHAERGDIISASMQRISGDLDSLLILADAQGNVLVSNDEDEQSPGSFDAAIYDLRILKTGNYVLVATRFGRDAGISRGGFSLTLDRLAPETLGKVPEKGILLDYGAVVTGDIDSDNLMRFYTIEAKKGEILIINAERTRGNLDPILVLYTIKAGALSEVASNDSGIRGQNARISGYSVPSDGLYILMVSRFNRDTGITAGGYSLSLVGRTGVTVGADGKTTLQYGSAVTALISDDNAEQRFNFTANAGDTINITMDVTSGNLIAQLILLDPAGKQVALDDRGTGDAKLPAIKLADAGSYTIVATRRGRDKGTTQGTYVLTLTSGNQR
jgi:hypothetical protein